MSSEPPSLVKTILFWNTYFGSKDFEFGLGSVPFGQCSFTRHQCQTTADRALFNQSDAVVFHVLSIRNGSKDMPTYRLPHQRWIFLVLESPEHTDVSLESIKENVFNWTMTYRCFNHVLQKID